MWRIRNPTSRRNDQRCLSLNRQKKAYLPSLPTNFYSAWINNNVDVIKSKEIRKMLFLLHYVVLMRVNILYCLFHFKLISSFTAQVQVNSEIFITTHVLNQYQIMLWSGWKYKVTNFQYIVHCVLSFLFFFFDLLNNK